ncbi:MAG: MotA/TolQ/ExbB proton channel family protein [Polyangiaceae bacterium]|nr:MotA/TolQ/ExbB proton channel family protein [Myxococcales bacterium]MCC6901703.1 MotA/TolQ/ExbB proton channel family protein [Polyangiaceae bacterium]
MNLVSWLQRLMTNFGAGWVMWLLIVLSVLSVAVMLERAWFYWSLRDDLAKLAHDLRDRLRANDVDGARKRMESSPSAEAAVVSAGLLEADRGSKAAEQAMQGAQALQRIKLERRLAFLGTLGNNAPFIGLFGTVIGVVQAFEALSRQNQTAQTTGAMAPQEVMFAIAEALVATAVGLAVAIPAVVMYNVFQRQAKAILANTDALTRVLLSHLAAVESGHAPAVGARSGSRKADAEEEE